MRPEPSRREAEIAELIVSGLTNKEIGAELGIHEQTVKNHISRLLLRWGMSNRTEIAVAWSRRYE